MNYRVITLDLEGVLIPEIWKMVATRTGIEKLNLTTRDISDYSELMAIRLKVLKDNNLTIEDIQSVLVLLNPLEGAVDFLNTLRNQVEVIILSDTFVEFFSPLRKMLGYPTIFCNSLEIDKNGVIQNYNMRIENGKAHTVKALQSMRCRVAASGDSYNDLGMLQCADYAAWFRPPQSICKEHTSIPVFQDYKDLSNALLSAFH